MKGYIPKLGDLVYIRKGRWESLGMIVDGGIVEQVWTIEWFGRGGTRYGGFTKTEISKHRQEFLKLKKTL